MFLLANVASLHGDGGDVKGAAGSLLVTVKGSKLMQPYCQQ